MRVCAVSCAGKMGVFCGVMKGWGVMLKLSKFNVLITKKLQALVMAGLMSVSLWAAPIYTPYVQAMDSAAGQIAGRALGAAINYNLVRNAWLSFGDEPEAQMQMLQKDMEEKGQDMTNENNAVVDKVMNQLIERGEYALKKDNLPFQWRVNNSEEWNAACYPHDYITVNKGLVEDLKHNEDMIAGVLGHEMVHGLHHHLANMNADNILAKELFSLISAGVDYNNKDLYKKLSYYIMVKNIPVPLENEADEYGFYLMTSAGFNPGGFVLEMLHMAKRNIASGNVKPSDIAEIMSGRVWDHPSDKNRLKNAKQLFSIYGYNHVEVRNIDEVYIDGNFLLKASPDEEFTSWENAYFIAGGIAKGIHDNRLCSMWGFREKANGDIDFLNNDRVYQPMKKAVREAGVGHALQEMIEAAYASDVKAGNRDKIYLPEYNRKQKIKEEREKASAKSEKLSNHYSAKAAKFNDLGVPALATVEAKRAIVSNESNANAYMQMGRASSLENKHENAVDYFDKSISIAPNNGFAYMYKGMSLYAMGREDEAISAMDMASNTKNKDETFTINVLMLMAKMQDEKGYEEDALNSYRKLHNIYPEFVVPAKYASRMR